MVDFVHDQLVVHQKQFHEDVEAELELPIKTRHCRSTSMVEMPCQAAASVVIWILQWREYTNDLL